jgi:shikimate kinase
MGSKGLASGSAVSPGAATIVNAMATGMGGAFAIELRVTATVTIVEGGKIEGKIVNGADESTELMETCVSRVLEMAGGNLGALVETRSDLPVARGLSSSSACSNAVVLATASALGKLDHETGPDSVLLNAGIDASVEAGVTVTGAFDDASASFYGGAVITDNARREIMRREEMPELEVAILVPEERSYSGEVDLERIRLLSPQVEIAHREALEGDIFRAITLNGLIFCASLSYDPHPAIIALESGALAAGLSGKGPAFVAIGEDVSGVARAWGDLDGDVILTRVDNSGSMVIE